MVALSMASDSVRYTTIWYNVSIGVFTCSFIAIIGYHLYLSLIPHFVSAIKEKIKLLKKNTSEDLSRLIRTPSYEINWHDSITDLYEPVNTNDYTLPERDDTVLISVVDICNLTVISSYQIFINKRMYYITISTMVYTTLSNGCSNEESIYQLLEIFRVSITQY